MPRNPAAVRLGAGTLYVAPAETALPTDLSTDWATVDAGWIDLGYTDEGSTVTIEGEFTDVMVAEEFEPVIIRQTSRQTTVGFAAKEMTARNLELALNGGTITTGAGIVTFEPPPAGTVEEVALGWESDDALERYVWPRAIQTGSVETPRSKEDAAILPMEFRTLVPATVGMPTFRAIISDTVDNNTYA